jgi:hypothetical protein
MGANVAARKGSVEATDCEKKCHVGFTAVQRQLLCSKVQSKADIGPAVCGSSAKDSLHMQFEKIIELCQYARNVHPSTCYESLNSKQRNSLGLKLCGTATSEFQSKCFASLSVIKGASKNESAVVGYCVRHAADDNFAPVDCVAHVVTDGLLSLQAALTACDAAVSSDNTLQCIHDFHAFTPATIGLKPVELVSLCASSTYGQYDFDSNNLNIVTTESIGNLRSAIARCFFAVFNYTEGKTQNSQQAQIHTSNHLSHTQRSHLCQSAPGNGLGPAVCALFSHVAQRSNNAANLKADDIVSLCMFSHTAGPMQCFVESKGLGTVEQRIDICRGAANSVRQLQSRRRQQLNLCCYGSGRCKLL